MSGNLLRPKQAERGAAGGPLGDTSSRAELLCHTTVALRVRSRITSGQLQPPSLTGVVHAAQGLCKQRSC